MTPGVAVALMLVANAGNRECNPDPTILPLPSVSCSRAQEGDRSGQWICTQIAEVVDGSPRTVFQWVWVPLPLPTEACDPANVCGHNSGYTCRCTYRGVKGWSGPCEWQLSERVDR